MHMLGPTRIFAFMMSLAIGLSLLAGWQMLAMKRDALAYARASGNNILMLLVRDLRNELSVHAQTLQTINNVVVSPDAHEVSGPALAALVQGHAASDDQQGTIVITDAHGMLLRDLHHQTETRHDLSMREYVAAVLADPQRIHLSHPFLPSYANASPSTALSRSVLDKDGKLVGVVAVVKDLRRLHGLVEGLELNRDSVVSIRLLDGTPLAQWPAEPRESTGEEKHAFDDFVASGRQLYVHDALNDSAPAWHGYKRVGDFPVVVSVELASGGLLQTWSKRATVTSGLLVLFNIATVLLAFRLARHLRQRDRAEHRLRSEASTDALTGLHNRRWFDDKARQEWHRHLRSGGGLAVLMLDIDQFKAYNDHYGHPMGDVALAKVAEQVRLGCRREEDGAARYGGEEFVVILPNTDLEGARKVAEDIRRQVEATALPHARGQRGVVTVSIGVASTSASTVESVEALLKVADENLYRAKEGGRNRVEGGQAWRRANNAPRYPPFGLGHARLGDEHGAAVEAAPGSTTELPARKVRRRITANGYTPYGLGVGRITLRVIRRLALVTSRSLPGTELPNEKRPRITPRALFHSSVATLNPATRRPSRNPPGGSPGSHARPP